MSLVIPVTITPSGPLVVADGATPSFLIKAPGGTVKTAKTAGTGFSLFDVQVDGSTVVPTNNGDGTYTYTFPPVHGNHTLTARVVAPD